ncbi:MAG: DUF1015 domain-containing protein, partial [Clostridiales bacterium]|nr:DUF1015 domain-containing protein [Clostridiales bacterium]
MADIRPFRALRYDGEKSGPIDKLVTPPYDVITPAMQDGYYESSPYNIIRLEWGKKFPADNEADNVYTRAARHFTAWQVEGVLRQDPLPCFYLYRQQFSIDGQSKERHAFIAALRAEGYAGGRVLPHEETLPKHKADRLELMRRTFANFSPIFGLYAQEDRLAERILAEEAARKAPCLDLTDESGVRHIMWAIDDPAAVELIQKKMAGEKIYIADGHHRYETASAFAKEAADKGLLGCQYIMIALVNLYDEGLVVLPTHRLVKNVAGLREETLIEQLKAGGFTVTSLAGEPHNALPRLLEQIGTGGEQTPSFGLCFPGSLYLLQLPDKESACAGFAPQKPLCWRELDVSLLHALILEKLLGIGAQEMAEEGFLGYTREAEAAVAKVESGEYQCSLLLGKPLVRSMLEVAQAGEKMPQKSTFFYPKIIAGLLIHKL